MTRISKLFLVGCCGALYGATAMLDDYHEHQILKMRNRPQDITQDHRALLLSVLYRG